MQQPPRALRLLTASGMDTGQQHPDKEECHRGQRKIGNFGRKISKNIARRHDESPYNRCVINRRARIWDCAVELTIAGAKYSFERLVRAVNERSLPTWPPRVKHLRLDPLSFGLSRTWSRPLGCERDTVSWRNFGHASRTASDRQATVTRRSLKRLTGRGREMSDIVDGLETWEWPR